MSDTQPEKKPSAQAEADGDETVTVEYNGESYVLPSSLENASLSVVRAIDDDKLTYALEALMGKEQYARFAATARVHDANDLFGVYAEAIGLESTAK
jgi:hypothetical protein